jgi:hypothetical protein
VLAGNFDKVGESGRRTGSGTFAAADGIKAASAKAEAAAGGLQSLKEHLDDVTGTARSLFGATTSAGEAIDRVTAAAKKNGKTLDENTAKGRANREALSNLAEALQRQYDATVAVNGAGAKSDGVAAANRASFIRLATALTGSKRKAEELANQLLGIPAKKDTKVNANTHDAEARIRALQEKLDALRGKTVTVTVAVNAGALNKARLGKQGPQINAAAGDYWMAADTNSTSRTGGATPVNLTNEVTVLLDGHVIGAQIDTAIRASEKRQQHRQQVRAR